MLTNYEKRKAQMERIGSPVCTCVATIIALTERAEKMIGKENKLTFDYYYDTSGSEEQIEKEIIAKAGDFVHKNRSEFFWRLEGYRIKTYTVSDLKRGSDYEVAITTVKNEIPQLITFDDIKAL